MNIAMLLEIVADALADREAVVCDGDRLTYADVLSRSRKAAADFSSAGVEHVGMVDLNSASVPVTLFGSAIAGLPFAPINYRLADDQLRSLVSRIAPAAVVVHDDVVPRVQGVEGATLVPSQSVLAEGLDEGVPSGGDPDEVAVLLFTSGTTGEPKAALLRHRHLTSYILGSVEPFSAGEEEATLVSVPPYHVAGIAAVLSSIYAGRRIVYLRQFSPEVWVKAVRDEGVTHAMVVPTMLGRILEIVTADGKGLPTLRHLSYGGGRMPRQVVEEALSVLPDVNLVNAYGLTETSSTIAVLGPDDHREAAASDDPAIRERLTSVGQPIPTLELEIRDEDGTVLGPNQRGEIWVRGEQVAGEYKGRESVLVDGWFPTKDAGWLDEGGYLFVDGRMDDVIVRGGENMSPGEIEAVLMDHPAVAECAVVGVPDVEWGEAVAAAIVLEPGATATAEELCEWVRGRLRSSKTPQIVDFRDELPYNETGKLLRRVLRTDLTAGDS